VIDTKAKLAGYLETLQSATWVAVDTEADSLHAYPEKICLIQISTAASDRLIDPLADLSIDPLLQALAGHELIMHGADYDLRLLRKHHEFVPGAIFDTMLAARLLGITQFGLSHLVQSFLNVKLEKGPQKANWAMRPLTPRMEQYARNDTRHLKPLSDRLKAELAVCNRLAWHQECCDRLIADCSRPREIDADEIWRIKGSHLLNRAGLAVLRELWRWRESEAVGANRPPFFILSHEAMVAIAEAAAANQNYEVCVPRHLSDRRRAGVQKAVAHGLALPADQHPRPLKRTSRRALEAERRRFAELEKLRNARAGELGLDPTLIASRATLSDLAFDWEKFLPELMNWQRAILEPPA
jgi:ribonuclease D